MEIDRENILDELGKYFNVKELVCDHTYSKFAEKSWQFLDTYVLAWLLLMRTEILKAPMFINGGKYTQRGLRCNMCDIVKGKKNTYLGGHVLGKAFDVTVTGMTAEEARNKIKAFAKDHPEKCPCKLRLEDGVSWLHFDVIPQFGIKDIVYSFKA